jgi:hypothetical protein
LKGKKGVVVLRRFNKAKNISLWVDVELDRFPWCEAKISTSGKER